MNLVLSIFSFSLLAVFLGIMVVKVGITDLTIICAIGVAMCGYDFYRSVRANEQH